MTIAEETGVQTNGRKSKRQILFKKGEKRSLLAILKNLNLIRLIKNQTEKVMSFPASSSTVIIVQKN